MLKNIKISRILIASFVILGLFVGIVGAVGLLNLNRSNDDATSIYGNNLLPITYLSDVHNKIVKIQTNTIYLLYERNSKKFDQRKSEIEQWVTENDESIAKYESNALTDKEKALLAEFKENLKQYRTIRDETLQEIKEEDYANALGNSVELSKAQTLVENGIMGLIKLNEERAQDSLSDIQENFNSSFFLSVGILVFAFVLAILLAVFIPRSINKPIKEIVEATKMMARGDLNATVRYRSENEFGQLADGMMTTVRTMQKYIGSISQTLGEMAKGDLAVSVDLDYIGDFARIKSSIVEITDSLNDILSQINVSSHQVLSGAKQVSSAAQALSQGSTEQASSIEELSATIQDISNQIAKNAENAASAKKIADNSSKTISSANVQMTEMITAMERINETSKKISRIIKTIDDIAFQTNILALNAAVEAARAGEAGKGFAVVADEVRNLASKSAEAAKDTTALIENSIQAVDKGTKIADETAKSLTMIVDDAKRSATLISMISEASALQSQAILQTTKGVEQISFVVQTNSATAEESAAASEELSSQADMLNQLVGKFVLRTQDSSLKEEPEPQALHKPRQENGLHSKY